MSETDNLYYHHVRDDLLPLFDNLRGINVLEVGCGSGATGAYLKHLGIARSVTGVEKEADPAREAAAQIDRVLCDDIETISFDNFNETFDVILLADVLEHLVDPWMTLTQLAGLLSNGGAIIASIPNVRYWRVIRDVVLKGDWHYSPFSGEYQQSHQNRVYNTQSLA